MVSQSDDYLLYQILSGKVSITYENKSYVIGTPSFEDLCKAEEIYIQYKQDAYLLGALSLEDLIFQMTEHGLWSVHEENQIEELPKQIENIKLDIYQTYMKLSSIDNKRRVLEQLEDNLNQLLKKRNKYILLSIEGIADFHKMCYLICASSNLDYNSVNLNFVYYGYLEQLIGSNDIRRLARSNTWQQYWSSAKLGNPIFDKVLTQDQRILLNWSKFYDSIHESAECPTRDVIDDDVLLDGWCLLQKQKRERQDGEKIADGFGDSGEIFVMTENERHAKRIYELNDAKSKLIRKQQAKIIQQKKNVPAQEMPSVKMELRQQANQAFRDKIKGK